MTTTTLDTHMGDAPASGSRDDAAALPSRTRRWTITLLGLLLFGQGLGKLLNLTGYVSALSAFEAVSASAVWPLGVVWMAAELLAGVGLLATGALHEPSRKASFVAALIALGTAIAYALMTTQAYARGLEVANCTCFGVFLAQRLSWFVLLQDAYMLFYTGWVVRKTYGWMRARAPASAVGHAAG